MVKKHRKQQYRTNSIMPLWIQIFNGRRKKTLAIVYVESNRKQIDKKNSKKVRCLDVASVYYIYIEHADHAVKEKE